MFIPCFSGFIRKMGNKKTTYKIVVNKHIQNIIQNKNWTEHWHESKNLFILLYLFGRRGNIGLQLIFIWEEYWYVWGFWDQIWKTWIPITRKVDYTVLNWFPHQTTLTYFWPMFPFYNPWKYQKTSGLTGRSIVTKW